MSKVTSVNECLQALVAKRLYEELASGDLLWHVVAYLGSFEKKLRSNQTYWRVPLMEHARGGAESLKLTVPKYVMDRARSKRWRLRLRESYLNASQSNSGPPLSRRN